MNLVCAEGLPGSEELNVSRCLNLLDRWADLIRRYTAACRPDFLADPSKYEHGEPEFNFICMASILKHPKKIGLAYQPIAIGNFFFSDSRDDFIHGLLMRELGTCCSFPVLFTAIGRRLGYPMHLSKTTGHFLCQWIEGGKRLNLECSCPGGGRVVSDEYFLTGPRPISASLIKSGRYLRPMPPADCLAAFLTTRGHCFRDNDRPFEAVRSYIQASEVSPDTVHFEANCQIINLRVQKKLSARIVGRPATIFAGCWDPTLANRSRVVSALGSECRDSALSAYPTVGAPFGAEYGGARMATTFRTTKRSSNV